MQVSVSGLPSGVLANPQSPFTVASGGEATPLLGASASASTGDASISVQGTRGSSSHAKTISLTVQSSVVTAVSRTTYARTDAQSQMDDPQGEPHHRHMAYHSANRHLFVAHRVFALTASGLTVVKVARVPLGIGTLIPASGPAAGGTNVTIRGSGFQSSASVTIGGKTLAVTFIDMNTLKVVTPALPAGAQRVITSNSDRESVSWDAAFIVNCTLPHSTSLRDRPNFSLAQFIQTKVETKGRNIPSSEV